MIDSIVITGILILMTITSVGVEFAPFEDKALVLIAKTAVFIAIVPFAVSALLEVGKHATKNTIEPAKSSFILTAMGFGYLIIMALVFVVIHVIAIFVVD